MITYVHLVTFRRVPQTIVPVGRGSRDKYRGKGFFSTTDYVISMCE